jgi:hypothetical protein
MQRLIALSVPQRFWLSPVVSFCPLNPLRKHKLTEKAAVPLYWVERKAVLDRAIEDRPIEPERNILPIIGIGETVARPPLPHDRTCGSASGGSAG